MARKRAVSQSPWYDELDRIVAPLNAYRKALIRQALPRKQSTQLIRDWPRLSELVWQQAVMFHQGDINKINTPRGKATAKIALKSSLTALNRIDRVVDHYVATWQMGRHPVSIHARVGITGETENHYEFADEVKKRVQGQRGRVEWFLRQNAGPTRPARRGSPIAAQTYMLQVLLAYFRHHKWDDTIKPHNFATGTDAAKYAKESLFVKTACAALGLEGLSSETRKFLSQPSLWAYEAFEQMTPSPLTKKRKQEFLAHYGL